MARLTEREEEVLGLIGETMNCRLIGSELDIAEFTVRKHRAGIMRKLNLRSTAQLTAYAIAARPHPRVKGQLEPFREARRHAATARD
jgi:DNA-binding CsgD family transcriptional regulator